MNRPCPFCGSDNLKEHKELIKISERSEHDEYWINCMNCGASGPNDLGISGAREQWNMRRPMEEFHKQLDKILDYVRFA